MIYNNLIFENVGSKQLLVTFGGIRQGIGMPVYEFNNTLKDIACDKVFIKDINQAWYHKGINEKTKNILELKKLLEKIINENQYTNVIFIGNSMGGYAAILFGILLNVNFVLAFSPQTFIDKSNRFWYKDKRWGKEIRGVYINNAYQRKFYNLKKNLKKLNYSTQIDVFYSNKNVLDKLHSERLIKQQNVILHSYDKGNHNIIKVLRDEGELIKIIRNRIE